MTRKQVQLKMKAKPNDGQWFIVAFSISDLKFRVRGGRWVCVCCQASLLFASAV
jgi:hypothetical protein